MNLLGQMVIYILPYYLIAWIISILVFGTMPLLIGGIVFIFCLLFLKIIFNKATKLHVEIDVIKEINKFPDFKKIHAFTILGYKTHKLYGEITINNNTPMKTTVYIITKKSISELQKDPTSWFSKIKVRKLTRKLYLNI